MHTQEPTSDFTHGQHYGGGGAFVSGILVGVALGAALGALFAPKPGNELRRQIADSSDRFRRSAEDAIDSASKKANDLVSRGRDAVERSKQAFDESRREAKRETVEAFPGAGTPTGV
jgi:gas vesicle protein